VHNVPVKVDGVIAPVERADVARTVRWLKLSALRRQGLLGMLRHGRVWMGTVSNAMGCVGLIVDGVKSQC
jgi:hypothetical protein